MADRTKSFGGVGPHPAVLARAPDAFRLVAAAFDKAHDSLVVKILPLALEVRFGGDVLLPRLDVRVVILNILVIVGIFIGQSAEAVAELVDDHRAEKFVVGGRECVGIVDASAAVSVSVGEDYDVFVRDSGEDVVHLEQVQGREVAVGIERVEVRVHRRLFPQSLTRHADSAVLGRRRDRDDVEPILHRLERLVTQKVLHRALGILEEYVHLALGVSFRKDGDVDLILGITAVQQHSCLRLSSDRPDQNVLRVNRMRKLCRHILVKVIELHGDLRRGRRHRHKEHVLETLADPRGLLGSLPFLEQSAERHPVKSVARGLVRHCELPVTPQRNLFQIGAPPVPSVGAKQFSHSDVAILVRPCEYVVDPQGLIQKPPVRERVGADSVGQSWQHCRQCNQKYSSHPCHY